MIKIRIRSVFAVGLPDHLRSRFFSQEDPVVEVPLNTSVGAFLRALEFLGPSEAFDDMMLHVFVNGKLRGLDYTLQSGDVVDLHIPVSGG